MTNNSVSVRQWDKVVGISGEIFLKESPLKYGEFLQTWSAAHRDESKANVTKYYYPNRDLKAQ